MSYTVDGKKPQYPVSKSYKKSRIKIYVALVVMLVIAGFVVNNHLKTHQILYLVNHFPVEAKVNIASVGDFSVAATTVKEVILAEGQYSLTMTVGEALDHKVDVVLNNSMMERFSGRSAFVVNVGKGAVLVWEEATYSENPDPNTYDPHKLYVGEGFIALKDIDYKFNNFPVSLKIKAGQKVKKRRVGVAVGTAGTLVTMLDMSKVTGEKIMSFAEAHLQVQPTNEGLVKRYLNVCMKNTLLDRGITFLEKQFNHKPVLVEWHRGYQVLCQWQGQV